MTTTPTTIELSPAVYHVAECTARARGLSVADYLAEAIMGGPPPDAETKERILTASQELSHLHEENVRIMDLIEETFDPEMAAERLAQEAAA